MIQGSMTRPLFPGGAVQQASAGITEGYHLESALPTLLVDAATRGTRMITLGGARQGVARARGVLINPVLDGADGVTITVGVFGINPVQQEGKIGQYAWQIDKIGSLSVTSSLTTVPKDRFGDPDATGNYRLGISLAYTPTALGTALATAYTPAPSVIAGSGSTQGNLFMPDVYGYYGLILDPVGSVGLNANYRLVT